jgi:hypothetical protein
MVIPAFPTEAEEAGSWDTHQELIAERFLRAAAAGELGRGRVARHAAARKEPAAPAALTLHVPEDDASRARTLASRKRLGYQAYPRMLIHEGLERDEQQAG